MINSTLAYLIARLDDLEGYQSELPPKLLIDDLETLSHEVMAYIGRIVDLRRLAQQLEALATIDFDSLHKAATILEDSCSRNPLQLTAESIYDLSTILPQLKETIDQVEHKITQMPELHLAITIDLKLGKLFEQALLCAANAESDLGRLADLVNQKMLVLNDEQLSEVWGRLLSEWEPNRFASMYDPEYLLPKTFFQFDGPQLVRQKVAQYVVNLKPKLILAMVRHGFKLIPTNMVPLSRILTWQAAEASEPVSEQEYVLARSLARLSSIAQRLFHNQSNEVAATLNVSTNKRLVRGPEFKEADAEYQQHPPKPAVVFLELRKVARIADLLITFETPIEGALRQYKLGLEVMAPEILKEFSSKGELLLQKELCRFLLERNIFSVGTKFGRSETDLLAQEPKKQYVLETKLFRRAVVLRPAVINHALVQLQSYLDQNPSTPRGILVIYNLTDSLLTAPRKWLQGRYWILPINLQVEPPSGRKRSIAIEPASNGQLIDVVMTENTSVAKTRNPANRPRQPKVSRPSRSK